MVRDAASIESAMLIIADSRDDGFGPEYLKDESSILTEEIEPVFSKPRSSSCWAWALWWKNAITLVP